MTGTPPTPAPAPGDSWAAAMSPAERTRSLAALIACIAMIAMGLGMMLPLLALAMERMDVSATLIGFNTAMPALAILLSMPLIPVILRTVPVLPFMAACLAICSISPLAYYLLPNIWIWFPIRFLNGAALGGLFMVAEMWVNQIANPARRGRLVGIYVTILSTGFAGGTVALLFTGYDSFAPYLVICLICGLALIPLLFLTHAVTPRRGPRGGRSMHLFFFIAPMAMLAALVYGALESDMNMLFPIYAVRAGAGEDQAVLILTVFAAGNILCQVPIGMLGDALGRRLILLLCGLTGAGGAALFPFIITTPWLFFPAAFFFGGAAVGLYTVALALIGDRFSGADLTSAIVALNVIYSAGALGGPIVGGISMDLWNPHGLAVSMALICGLYVMVAAVRMRLRPAD